ncbi:hypothetical protein CLOSCI_04003 [[Clostridium] scindens ATCC 35704]|nr:hypothetical protein CLOSCI_04003 [[Clostridium] scindens ATCC 35704]
MELGRRTASAGGRWLFFSDLLRLGFVTSNAVKIRKPCLFGRKFG